MSLKDSWSLLKATFQEWSDDNVSVWAAALAYYTIFSLAPVLLIAIAVAGLLFGEQAARGEIVAQMRGLVGQTGAEAIEMLLANANRNPSGGVFSAVAGVAALLLGASGVFGQLQGALNTIWDVQERPGWSWWRFIKARLLSFAMVLVVGFLATVSLILSATLAAVGRQLWGEAPEYAQLARFVDSVGMFLILTLLFAALYKVLPDAHVKWSDLWIGAAATALLFSLGKFLIGLYLGNSAVGTTFGAAGSLVVLLIWIFYSSQVILFGAEFTQVYSKFRARDRNAVPQPNPS